MAVTLVCLLFVFNVVTTYKYLPESIHTQYGPSHITFHQYTAAISSIPHHVLIVYSRVYCSGSLVKSRIVVTAASCLEGRKTDTPVIVKVGSPFITGLGQVIEVLEVKSHEYYGHDSNRNNDIAILMLKFPPFPWMETSKDRKYLAAHHNIKDKSTHTKRKTICKNIMCKEHVSFRDMVKKIILVEPEIAIRVGTVLDVSGWGSVSHKSRYANMLLWSEMVVLDRNECIKAYPHLMTSSNFCVRYQPDRQLSDNGGPAEYDQLLVGIVSFGAARSVEPYVAVLTNVSYFNRWILLNSKRFLEKYCVPPHMLKLVSNEYTQSEEDHGSYAI